MRISSVVENIEELKKETNHQTCTTCNYRPQTKFAKVMFSQVFVCPRGCLCPGGWSLYRGSCPGQVSVWGSLSGRVSVWGSLSGGSLSRWILRARDRDRDILTRLRLGHQRPVNCGCPIVRFRGSLWQVGQVTQPFPEIGQWPY